MNLPVPASSNLLFAMDTHFRCGANLLPERAAQFRAVKDAGYDGFHAMVNFLGESGPVEELLAAERVADLALVGIYQEINVKVAPTPEALGALERGIARLPQSTLVELALSYGEFGEAAGDAARDGAALAWLEPIAALLAGMERSGSIYPHFGFLAESCSDALRLAGMLDHPAIGVGFGAYHWFRVGKEPDLPALLAAAAPRLRSVNLNGSRLLEAGQDVNGLNPTIDPLDVGSLPVAEILAGLRQVGYRGPIGVQGYGVDVPAAEALRRSRNVLQNALG